MYFKRDRERECVIVHKNHQSLNIYKRKSFNFSSIIVLPFIFIEFQTAMMRTLRNNNIERQQFNINLSM